MNKKLITAAATGAVALCLSACGSSTGSPAPATPASPAPQSTGASGANMTTWMADLGHLDSTFTSIATDASSGDLASVGNDCQAMIVNVNTLEGDGTPASFTAQDSQDWATALSDLRAGGTECVNGTTTSDSSLIVDATTQITDATGLINGITARING